MTNEILGIRSVPLAEDTRQAWRENGVVFRARNRPHVWDIRFHEPHIRAVLNLGNIDMNFGTVPVPVFNHPHTIRAISAPTALRRTLNDDFLPEATIKVPHWHKTNGFKGIGKQFHDGPTAECHVLFGDIQRHIEGAEYRIITVGDKVVQASRKHGKVPNFTFEWVGVKGVSNIGVIPMLKSAVDLIPGGERSIIGWDIMSDGVRPWILEANTSPGVNAATASRIVKRMKELL